MSSNKRAFPECAGKLLNEYADRQQLNLIQTFEDVETARTSGWQQFGEMLKWLKRNGSNFSLEQRW